MKKLMLICAPVTSRSGYGAHARDLTHSFLQHNKYDVKILDVQWGDCPRNALDKNNSDDKKILDCILPEPKMDRQPDVYVDIRIPNEFQQIGKFNIGITAGVETTAVSQNWLECCNKMDLIIVPSEHSKSGFVQSVYEKMQKLPDGKQQKIGELKLEKPIEVLFEGTDENIYKPLTKNEMDSEFFDMLNEKVPEKFAFLFLGQWTKGGYGEDRSRFPEDWNLPNVYLLHGSFSDEEINNLYNHPKIKAMISLTHGEGFGRPLLEATMTGLPVIASGWSGQLDFLDGEKSMLLGGDMKEVPKSQHWENIIIPQSQWFNVNETQAYKALNYCFENQQIIKSKGKEQMEINKEKFTLKKMTEILDKIINKYQKDSPQQVSLNLPKLKKVENKTSDSSTIKLPKLKKVTSGANV
jgi:hypothetical protein